MSGAWLQRRHAAVMHLRGETLLIFAFLCVHVTPKEPRVESSYVAAVYEHRVLLNPEPRVPLSRREALEHLQKNLDVYELQAERAAQQGAQILVFPEDGLQGFNFSRSSISGYLETVPDPQQESWNPCVEPGKHNNTEVLQRLSCMARRSKLYLVANMPDLQPCDLQASSCPADGHWQFNTNVVFNSEGLLVARYHKNNLYFEEAFDAPPQTEIRTFDTPFAGKFGLIICFDILFHDPTVHLVEMGVRQLIFPAAWMNQLPLLDVIQFQRAFSLGANVTLLAASIRSDQHIMTGSGIYSPFSATYHHASKGDPEEGRLVVARVPILEPLWEGHGRQSQNSAGGTETAVESGFCHQDSCADPPTSSSSEPTFTSSMMHDPFKFALLKEKEGKLKVCDGTFCCSLQYKQLPQGGNELYALGAFAGTHTVNGRYALQVCALVRCAQLDESSCGQEVVEAETRMDFVLEGIFQTSYVYPSILSSRMVLEQPENVEKTSEGRVTLRHSNMMGGLVTACLYGRMYQLDNEQRTS